MPAPDHKLDEARALAVQRIKLASVSVQYSKGAVLMPNASLEAALGAAFDAGVEYAGRK